VPDAAATFVHDMKRKFGAEVLMYVGFVNSKNRVKIFSYVNNTSHWFLSKIKCPDLRMIFSHLLPFAFNTKHATINPYTHFHGGQIQDLVTCE
jgi:hypothetical protein